MTLSENWQDTVRSESSGTMEVTNFFSREKKSAPGTTCEGTAEWVEVQYR